MNSDNYLWWAEDNEDPELAMKRRKCILGNCKGSSKHSKKSYYIYASGIPTIHEKYVEFKTCGARIKFSLNSSFPQNFEVSKFGLNCVNLGGDDKGTS